MPSDQTYHKGRSDSPAPQTRRDMSDRGGRHGDDPAHRHRRKDDDDNDEGRSHRHHHHRSHRRKRSRSSERHVLSKRNRPTAASMMSDDDADAGETKTVVARELPLGARTLSRHGDYEAFEALFANYLDLHYQIDVFELPGRELQQRWRSFVRRWNAGKLSEGWYDPETFVRVTKEWDQEDGRKDRAAAATSRGRLSPDRLMRRGMPASPPPKDDTLETGNEQLGVDQDDEGGGSEDSDDEYVPPLPPPARIEVARAHECNGKGDRQGPGIPSIQDLDVRRAEEEEARLLSREEIRLARRADRVEQKERLDEILPRAAAGTRERQLEKKRLVNEKMRGFREGSAGATEEAGDGELMGEGGGVSDYKAALAREQRRKTEREVRREAEARAKLEELQQRMKRYQEKEERTIGALRELARQKFGE